MLLDQDMVIIGGRGLGGRKDKRFNNCDLGEMLGVVRVVSPEKQVYCDGVSV